MDKPFIAVSGVSKKFEGEKALRDVSVEIREGESLGLLGRSGSGKSVLLHMLQRTFGLYGDDTLMYNVLQSLERIGYPSERRFRRAYELLKSVKMLHRISFPAA
jgi:ABC-type phosphate/phosphonate transport system ATPase subunit